MTRSTTLGALTVLMSTMFTGCAEYATLPVSSGTGPNPTLPAPNRTLIPTVNIARATAWGPGESPRAATGFKVSLFAAGLEHPRWLYVLPNGDVLVAESNAPAKPVTGLKSWITKKVMARAGAGVKSPDRITLLRDTHGDGIADLRDTFLQGLRSPIGMALIDSTFYVANTNAVVHVPYSRGQTRIDGSPETLVELPAEPINHHWTKNLLASKDGKFLYVSVGSNSNVAENGLTAERGRAAILEIDRDGGASRVFASGLRNPVGLDWHPVSGELWTTVNERDELGSDLVPDYLTSVQRGGFYGWPYSYYGQHIDTRVQPQEPERVAAAIKPDYALGPHTASLGFTFYDGNGLPEHYNNGAFIAQHGSWNRRPRSGYKVVFVPFAGGHPRGELQDVLTGFIDTDDNARGRPVCVVVWHDGSLLVSDDVGNRVWRISAEP
ncbi:MAG: glucose/arabinose dehydrogenase [Gammaproteobacteria bacterium]|jgi:glucose/arabinose dehydrogenase